MPSPDPYEIVEAKLWELLQAGGGNAETVAAFAEEVVQALIDGGWMQEETPA